MPDEEVIAMYEGSHVPLEIMSDFYGKVNIICTLFSSNLDAEDANVHRSDERCPAEYTRPHYEAVHGHILPAGDDPPLLCQRLLHEAQHRLRTRPSLQGCKGKCAFSSLHHSF